MAWTQAMETSQGWWVDLSCFEYSCSTIWVVEDENFKVGGFELLKMKNVKVGMVQRGEVDIGGGMFSLMKERAVNFKCLLTKILNLNFFLHFLPLFRRWWTLATASVLRRIQSWWKLQGNIYIVLSEKSFSTPSFLKNILFSSSPRNPRQSQSKQWWAPFSTPVWAAIGVAAVAMAAFMFIFISKVWFFFFFVLF